jgi:hypothetical protein
MPIIPALGRPRQEDLKCKRSLGYIANWTPAWPTKWDHVPKTTKQTKQKPWPGAVAHTYNPIFSGYRDWKDQDSSPVQAKSS